LTTDTNPQLSVTAALRALTTLVMGLAMLVASSLAAVAQRAPDTFADLVDQVSGAVVNITTNTSIAAADQGPNSGSPLEDFFEEFRRHNSPDGNAP